MQRNIPDRKLRNFVRDRTICRNLRNPGRDISFPIFIRKEIETRKLEQKISRLIDLLYRLNDIISRLNDIKWNGN